MIKYNNFLKKGELFMKKFTKLFGLLLASSLTLVGCGNEDLIDTSKNNTEEKNDDNKVYDGADYVYDAKRKDWLPSEKAILADKLANVDIPYSNFEGESLLTWVELQNGDTFARKTAPNCDKAVLQEYSFLFTKENGWDDSNVLDEEDSDEETPYYYYEFTKEMTTDDGSRYITARFYGGTFEGDDYSNNLDGTGTFVLEIYDNGVYEWPSEEIELYAAYFLGLEETTVIPAYEGADYYDLYLDDLLYSGYFAVSCYTDDTDSVDTYIAALLAAGYTNIGDDGYGYIMYLSPNSEIYICCEYTEQYKCLDVYICYYYAGLDLEGDELTYEAFNITETDKAYEDYTATGESGAKYTGQMAATDCIQIRARGNNSGIVTTESGGTINAVGVEWNSQTTSGSLDIYASNEPFTIADMYSGNMTKVGTISTEDEEMIFTFETEYAYVGVRSAEGAICIDLLVFNWKAAETGENNNTPAEGGENNNTPAEGEGNVIEPQA